MSGPMTVRRIFDSVAGLLTGDRRDERIEQISYAVQCILFQQIRARNQLFALATAWRRSVRGGVEIASVRI